MRAFLLLLAAVLCMEARAQPLPSVTTRDGQGVMWQGDCVRAKDERGRAGDPCPAIVDYRTAKRADLENEIKDRVKNPDKYKNRHPLILWPPGEENGKYLGQWPSPRDFRSGWPKAYHVVVMYEVAPKPPLRVIEYLDRPVPYKVVEKQDRFVPFPVTRYREAPARKKEEEKKVDRKDDDKKGDPGPGDSSFTTVPVRIPTPGPATTLTVLGAGGAGALGGYALTRVLRRRRQDEDEADIGPAAPAAPVLNARVHPDRHGVQKVIEERPQ